MSGKENGYKNGVDEERREENGPSGGGARSGYLLLLSEEIFKYLFFLFFIAFGAIYYATAIMPPDYSPLKVAGLYVVVCVIFAIFYILLPVKRMLFSNLQIYREKLCLTARYDALARFAVESVANAKGEGGTGSGRNQGYTALVTFRTDYYVAFAPIFVSLVISMIAYAVYFAAGAFERGTAAQYAADWIAAGILAAGFISVAAGFVHLIDWPDSTHRGFLFLIILVTAAFSAYLCVNRPFFAQYRAMIAMANAAVMACFVYRVGRGDALTIFVRTPDRSIFAVEAISGGRKFQVASLRRVEFGTVCRFVQTPFAIGFTVCDADDESGFGDLYYCDAAKESLERVCEVFADRIAMRHPAGGYFAPISVSALAAKYGAGQTMILLLINAVTAAMVYQMFF